MFLGGMIGLERGFRGRPAGFRTYLIVCLGAALTMILSQYHYVMMETEWAALAKAIGVRTDVSRFGAQVINGIGFLGAGTIIVTGRQQVKGLTTAAGLWASACMGLAVGAGFYECVFLAFVLIFCCIRWLPQLGTYIVENARNMNIYVEFESMDDIGPILSRVKAQDVQIYSVEIDRGREERSSHPSATLSIRLNQRRIHEQVLAGISDLESVYVIEEL
ncbi:MAG: MgtC/SapB family protein [Oscillibacter sp.]|nr:MgtC/SapB family protein [Oscillibacter sp.]